MALEYNTENFTGALTKLPDYGGYEALADALGEAYPDATFSPMQAGDYSTGFVASNWKPYTENIPSFISKHLPLREYLEDFGGFRTREKSTPSQLAAYEQIWPTLTGLVNPPVAEQQNTDVLTSQPSSSSGAITTTSGSIPPEGIFGETVSNTLPPTSSSLTDPTPSQEEVNSIAYKDWVNKTVKKDIFDLQDNKVKVDSSQIDVVDRIPSLANSSVDELIATATSERIPYTSQVPNSANKYLQGGPNAFAYSGEGGYAAERQRMLNRAPDIYQGSKVPWSRLGKAAPSDVYYGNQRFGAPTGEVVDGGGGEEFDWNAWRDKMRESTIAERVEIDTDNIFDNIKDEYGDLADDRLADIMEDVKEYWPSLAGTGVDLSNIKTTEDLYGNPIVQQNISEGFGKIKDIFTETGEIISKGKNILVGVIDELTRITERKGGRGSVTEGDPFGVSTTGMAEGLLGLLTLDFDGKRLDRQEYGNIQPAALVAASQLPGLLGVQLANELKDLIKDAINVSTFANAEYKAGGSVADARHNATEFAGSILRPFVQTIAKVISGKTTDASIKDLIKKADLENIKTGEPWRTDFKGYELFPEKVEDKIRGGTDANWDPTDRGPVPEAITPSEIDTSALVDEVLKETVTETGTLPRRGPSPALGTAIAPIVNVTIPKEQEIVSPQLGQGVSAGSAPSAGSTLSAGPVTGEVKSVTIDDTPPPPTIETDSLGDQSVDITDNNIDPVNISTADLIEMVNPVAETPPDYTDITYPVGKDGNPYTGNDISEIAHWKTTPVSSTDINKIKDIFGNDVGEAYAKYGEGSKDNDSWKGQGNKPLDLRNADMQKMKKEWTTQKEKELEEKFIASVTDKYVEGFLGYSSSDKGGITEEEWLKLSVQGGGSFKGGPISDYLTYRKEIQTKTLSDRWKKEQEKDSNAGLAITIYKTLVKGSGGIDPTKANKQKLKELFSDALKDFAKQNVLLNFDADSIEETLDVDYIKMLDNMGIGLSGLHNVGGETASEGRPNIYIEPLEKAIDEQFTADTLENKLLSNLIDAGTVESFLNSPPEHQQALIDQYRNVDKNEEAARALEQLLTEDEPDIDAASEFFAENASNKVLQKWLGFRDDIDELEVEIGDLIDEKDWDWGD